MSLPRFFRGIRLPLLFLLVSLLGGAVAHAKELKIETKLIWGTNEEKSPKKEHEPVDEATAAKLRKVFKWKNYFVERKVTGTVPSRGSNQFKLSDKCIIEITELEGPKVEVKLIGKGQPVHKAIQEIRKGEWFVYTGDDDKHECSWFVIITELDEK
ncbi:MAG: hypothetical protein QOF48_2151 [Verrucomicrobiota bacterium]|jgi:hypothetical protein